MVKRISKRIESESELDKLIKDTRNLRQAIKSIYNPTKFLIINGTEVANYRNSGFPKFGDISNIVTNAINQGYRPLYVIIEESMRYLIEEKELVEYEQALNSGLTHKQLNCKLIESNSIEEHIKQLLKLAYENNAKIMTNENIIETYKSLYLKPGGKFEKFEGKPWQIKYNYEQEQFKIIE